jgi:hypothetical protein
VAIGPTGNWTAPRLGADAQGNVIAVWAARGGGSVWAARRRGDRWNDPVRIGSRQTADRVELTVRSDGTAIAGWIGDIDLVVARFDPSRGWEAPEVAASPSATFGVAATAQGRAFVAWTTTAGVHVRAYDAGAWQEPARIAGPLPDGLILDTFGIQGLAANDAGEAVVLWGHAALGLERDVWRGVRASWRESTATWSAPEWAIEPSLGEMQLGRVVMDAQGTVLVGWETTHPFGGDQPPSFARGRRASGWTLEKTVAPEVGLRLGQIARGPSGDAAVLLIQSRGLETDARTFYGGHRDAGGDWQSLFVLAGIPVTLSSLTRFAGNRVGLSGDAAVGANGSGIVVWADHGFHSSTFDREHGWGRPLRIDPGVCPDGGTMNGGLPSVVYDSSGTAVAVWLGCQQPWTARLME